MTVIDTEKILSHDVIISEVRKIKNELARAFCYDVKKMLAEARIKQKASGRNVLSPPVQKNA